MKVGAVPRGRAQTGGFNRAGGKKTRPPLNRLLVWLHVASVGQGHGSPLTVPRLLSSPSPPLMKVSRTNNYFLMHAFRSRRLASDCGSLEKLVTNNLDHCRAVAERYVVQ